MSYLINPERNILFKNKNEFALHPGMIEQYTVSTTLLESNSPLEIAHKSHAEANW